MAKKQPELALSVGVRSERGRRDENQDKMSAFSTPLGMVYVVADGMGGYRGGAEASRRVVEGFQRHLNGSGMTESTNLKERFQRAAQQTNTEILTESSSGDPTVEGMGSTVVLALLRTAPTGMQMMAAHIGDSRGYLLREGTLYRITRDHSMVQRMVDTGLLTSEQARNHPESNVLSRAIGKQPNVDIEVGDLFAMAPGDVVMLCSDGLWGPLTDKQIGELLNRNTGTQQIADALVALALECGSDDNITVQVIRYEYRDGFKARRKDVAPAYPPPGAVEKCEIVPRPKTTSGKRSGRAADVIFAVLGGLVLAALCLLGYQYLQHHKARIAAPNPDNSPTPSLGGPQPKPSPRNGQTPAHPQPAAPPRPGAQTQSPVPSPSTGTSHTAVVPPTDESEKPEKNTKR